ncbi:hypothetical protein [Curtobacterium sp. RRHDQ10]|uniref:hypothetical protein n=1 Tax=Curtobacterium phyllosphaerae TaxID=3413379 RepID=UPI003BF38DBA
MDDDAVGSLDRAALEQIAFGPDADPADVATARAELVRRAAGPAAGRATGPAPGGGVAAAAADVRDPAPGLPSGAATGVPDPAPTAVPRPRPRARWRLWALLGGTAVLAGALGVTGTVVAGRIGPPVVQDGSSDSGSETLSRVLAQDQTPADVLPTAITASVDRSSARLLFANYADRPPVPWVVWIAKARTGGDLCVIASPDRYASDVTCVPSAQVLHGELSYVTRDGDQGLAIRMVGGVARIDLIGGE